MFFCTNGNSKILSVLGVFLPQVLLRWGATCNNSFKTADRSFEYYGGIRE